MSELVSFISNHWLLSIIFIILCLSVLIVEYSISKDKSGVSVEKAVDLINHNGAVILDFRSKEEYSQSHIINSENISSELLSNIERSKKLLAKYRKKPLVIVSGKDAESNKLTEKLKSFDFKEVYFLSGGIQAWKSANLPLVKK